MATKPFFIPDKEIRMIDSMNEELIDEVIGQSVDIYKVSVDNTEDNLWNKPLNGGMIFGLSAAYSFLDKHAGNGGKNDDFLSYLNKEINLTTVKEHIHQTAGPIMDVLILEKLVKQYNEFLKLKKWTTIGETVFEGWRNDPAIHGSSKVELKTVETEEEED